LQKPLKIKRTNKYLNREQINIQENVQDKTQKKDRKIISYVPFIPCFPIIYGGDEKTN